MNEQTIRLFCNKLGFNDGYLTKNNLNKHQNLEFSSFQSVTCDLNNTDFDDCKIVKINYINWNE